MWLLDGLVSAPSDFKNQFMLHAESANAVRMTNSFTIFRMMEPEEPWGICCFCAELQALPDVPYITEASLPLSLNMSIVKSIARPAIAAQCRRATGGWCILPSSVAARRTLDVCCQLWGQRQRIACTNGCLRSFSLSLTRIPPGLGSWCRRSLD